MRGHTSARNSLPTLAAGGSQSVTRARHLIVLANPLEDAPAPAGPARSAPAAAITAPAPIIVGLIMSSRAQSSVVAPVSTPAGTTITHAPALFSRVSCGSYGLALHADLGMIRARGPVFGGGRGLSRVSLAHGGSWQMAGEERQAAKSALLIPRSAPAVTADAEARQRYV
jgi:hypothetical protein